jgi:hypothetical protein
MAKRTPAEQLTSTESSSSSSEQRADSRLSWVVAAAAVSAVIVVATSFFPAARLWGVNHLAFVPPAVRIIATALLALAFLPALARPLSRIALAASERHAAASRGTGLTVAASIAIVSVALFFHFRAATNLLGDGQLITQSFEAAEEGHDQVIMRSAQAILTEEPIAPGTTLLYYSAVKTGARFKSPPVLSMRMLNCILGGVFVFTLLCVARSKMLTAELRVWLVVLMIFAPSTMLFFGYIENYTLPYLFSFIYVATAFAALHRRVPLWLPLLPLAAACYAHVHSILLIPSYLYVLVWMLGRRRRATLMRYWLPLLTVGMIVVIVGCASTEGMKKFFVPFGVKGNSLLSPRHFLDVANELLMLLPIFPVVATMGWLGRRAERALATDTKRDRSAVKDPTALFSHPVEWQFVGTILIACAMYNFFFRPEIGMARDWDLFTMATVGLVPLTLLALNRYVRVGSLAPDAIARFAVPSRVLVVVMGVAWVMINASTDRTIDRFQRTLAYDKAHAAYAWENLAILEHKRGHLDDAIRTMEIAIDHGRNPRHVVRLAVYMEEAGRTDEAIAILEKLLVAHPDFAKARYRLALFLEKKGDWVRMLDVAREGARYHPDEPFYRFLYGESLLRAGHTEQAIEVFESCRAMNLPPTAKQRVDQVLSYYKSQQQKK